MSKRDVKKICQKVTSNSGVTNSSQVLSRQSQSSVVHLIYQPARGKASLVQCSLLLSGVQQKKLAGFICKLLIMPFLQVSLDLLITSFSTSQLSQPSDNLFVKQDLAFRKPFSDFIICTFHQVKFQSAGQLHSHS